MFSWIRGRDINLEMGSSGAGLLFIVVDFIVLRSFLLVFRFVVV